jgi:hypothetical protein
VSSAEYNANKIEETLLSADRDVKMRFLSEVIRELTFAARSKMADGADVLFEVNAINRVAGYLVRLLERPNLDSERPLAKMVSMLSQHVGSSGFDRLVEDFVG